MKFTNLKVEKLEEFFKVIDQCKDNVYLVSPDMNINLKSRIAQYVSLASLFAAGNDEISEIEIAASNKYDIDLLYNFMVDTNN